MKQSRVFRNNFTQTVLLCSLFVLAAFLCSCEPPGGSPDGVLWTWVSGGNTTNQYPVYGTKGTADPANVPGSRYWNMSWTGNADTFWVFGGQGLDAGDEGYLNDLWKFDGTAWTWVSGSDTRDQSGVYGTKGTAAPANVPGSRISGSTWIDAAYNLWLFGGSGYDNTGSAGYLNDLWKFDGTNWTWVSGSDTNGQAGTYGTKGTAAAGNVPGARTGSISGRDGSGNFWLFGGYGYDSTGNTGYLNDLWRFDGTNWTWISGSDIREQTGVYGTIGVADGANIPGARGYSIGWMDTSDNLWLFGGNGYDGTGSSGSLNDVWRFDGANWTWISGTNLRNQTGVYGTLLQADAANAPGGRSYSIGWLDSSDNLWLFGGNGYDGAGSTGYLNDVWRFDGTTWTWFSGANLRNQTGVYGTQGTVSAAHIPGSRYGGISWFDTAGNLWLFGGRGFDSVGNIGSLNDVWKADPLDGGN